MPTIYSYQKPNRRVLNFAFGRQQEIQKQIEQLQLEHALMQRIIEQFDPLVCPDCKGEGTVMRTITGCECDGPRQHKCVACGGTGETSN